MMIRYDLKVRAIEKIIDKETAWLRLNFKQFYKTI